MFPASRFRKIPETSAFDAEISRVVAHFEKSGKKWYRIFDGDLPLTGHRSHFTTNVLLQTVRDGWDYYPSDTSCVSDFQEAAVTFQKRFRNVDYSPQSIIPVPGVASGWQLIHNVILDPGSVIVVLEPAQYMWGPASYAYYLKSKIAQVPMVEENDWEPDLEELRAAITKKTKAIVVDQPNNPTGHIYSRKARRHIIDIAGEHDIPVISDEVYDLIVYDGNESPSMAAESKDVPIIVMTSFSKFFMKPGWRIGYVAFHDPHEKIAEIKNASVNLARTYGHATTCIPLPILVAATRVLTSTAEVPHEFSSARSAKVPIGESVEMIKELQIRRDYSFKRLSEIEGVSVVNAQASLYLFPKLDFIGKIWKTTEEFIVDMLKEKHVLFVAGTKFGCEGAGHFRTLFLNEIEVLEEVYNRLADLLRKKQRS